MKARVCAVNVNGITDPGGTTQARVGSDVVGWQHLTKCEAVVVPEVLGAVGCGLPWERLKSISPRCVPDEVGGGRNSAGVDRGRRTEEQDAPETVIPLMFYHCLYVVSYLD